MNKQVIAVAAAVFALALAGGCATAREDSASRGASGPSAEQQMLNAEHQRLNPIGFPSGA
jgi:outer membrane murein-binding lipoprotein Lpp